jgi:PhzF family phenazine biosynthesis protein
MNLSETAFLRKQKDCFELRWFTPVVEVELCGHATLAAAHILWEMGYMNRDERIDFDTKSGRLSAVFRDDWIELDFPYRSLEDTDLPEEIADALSVDVSYAGKSGDEYLVEVASEEVVKNIKPDFTLLSGVASGGIMVTSRSASYDFVSRYFAPYVGINEDPVTGSAHCTLGPYWKKKMGKSEFTACQASSRGGILKVRVGEERVSISGQAVTVIRGELLR